MFERKPNRFYTCWTCLLGDFLKVLKDSDELECYCEKEDVRKILGYKDKTGNWRFEIVKHGDNT